MQFKKYPKVHRIGKEEVEGILDGHCFIQEKIDGANTSIWLEDGVVQCGSRNRHLQNTGFGGFVPYAQGHIGIADLLRANPDYRLYGEWLVRHTIAYKETAYKEFYLFDIEFGDKFFTTDEVHAEAIEYGIKTPELFGYIENPTEKQLKDFVGKSEIAERGEGIVIKNPLFINKFCECVYGKIVTEKFQEMNAITFGGNNKYSESYWEMYVTNKYITLGRVQKILNKIQPTIDEKLDLKHIPRITNTVYNDMITEEIWDIQKKVPVIDFKKLRRLVMLKSKQIFIDILNEDISVADKINE